MFDENEIDIENSFLDNIKAGENHITDKGYELCTHEKQAEFAKKRNYHISNTDNPIDFPDELEDYRKQAMELWSDSCTTPRKTK